MYFIAIILPISKYFIVRWGLHEPQNNILIPFFSILREASQQELISWTSSEIHTAPGETYSADTKAMRQFSREQLAVHFKVFQES